MRQLSWPMPGGRSIELVDEPLLPFEANPPAHTYDQIVDLEDPDVALSRYGLVLTDASAATRSVLLTGAAGCTGVNERSLVALGDHCFVAIGVYVVALELSTLRLSWHRQVDQAACFGVHLTPEADALIAHGEMEISRWSVSGDAVWRASGADIFTGALALTSRAVVVDDFGGDRYAFDLVTGLLLAR